MNKQQDYYDPPETRRMIGPLASAIDNLDLQLNLLDELLVHIGPWVDPLPKGREMQQRAATNSQRLGRITLQTLTTDLNRLARSDWTSGSPERVLHLQLIRRFYLLHIFRCMYRALAQELVGAHLASQPVVRQVVAQMRKSQAEGYASIRAVLGMEPEAFDYHLDQDPDLVEARTAAYLWLLLSGKFGERQLLTGRTGSEWQRVRNEVQAPGAYPAELGNGDRIGVEYQVLVHCLNDTKLKLLALMAAIACTDKLPATHLVQYLMHVGTSTKLDEPTVKKLLMSFELAFQAVGSKRFEQAIELWSHLAEASQKR